jgi:hypothetical protein
MEIALPLPFSEIKLRINFYPAPTQFSHHSYRDVVIDFTRQLPILAKILN